MWAKLSETKAGDTLIADSGFSCMDAGRHVVKAAEGGGLYIECDEGEHHLNGQADDGEHMNGLMKECQHCAREPEPHWIETDNNGPIVPCPTCNPEGEIPRL